MPLTPTAYVILGILAFHSHSGYGVKKIADESLRAFWNVSFAQIYPELERLRKQKLIEPDPGAARGGRQRVVYRLTAAGRAELRSWLTKRDTAPIEVRDEMLVKLFFSDALTKEELRKHLTRMREREAAIRSAVAAAQEHVEQLPHGRKRGPAVVTDVLAGMHDGYLNAIERAERTIR